MQPQESNISSNTKHANTLGIVFGITTLAFAGLAAFFGVNYFKQPAKTDAPQGAAAQGTMASEYTEVNDLMVDVLSSVIDSSTTYIYNYIQGGSGMSVKPDGMNTYVPTKFNLSAKVRSNNGEKDLATLKNKLTQKGFSAIGTLPFQGSAGPQIDGYKNDNNVTCSLYLDIERPSLTQSEEYVYLQCAKPSWSWLTDDEKNLLVELETAYFEKTGKYPTILGGKPSEIKNSTYSPYQTLWINVGGAAGLFYRTSSESKWQYFTATQGTLECKAYDTDDLKKAYLGEECYNMSNPTETKYVEL